MNYLLFSYTTISMRTSSLKWHYFKTMLNTLNFRDKKWNGLVTTWEAKMMLTDALKLDKFEFKFRLHHFRAVTLVKLLNFSDPQFHHQFKKKPTPGFLGMILDTNHHTKSSKRQYFVPRFNKLQSSQAHRAFISSFYPFVWMDDGLPPGHNNWVVMFHGKWNKSVKGTGELWQGKLHLGRSLTSRT